MLHYKIYHLREKANWLVFIHGAGGSIITWKYQVEAFRPYFNLLLLDLRDHGRSKNIQPAFKTYDFDIVTDDVLKVIDHLGIQKAHFLSLSLGSIILQKIDEKRPELIDRMVMAGGIFKADLRISFFAHSAKLLSYILPYRVIYDLFSYLVLPKKNHREARRLFRRQSKKLSPREYLKWIGLYKGFFEVLHRFFQRELHKWSLIVMGEEDHVFLKAAKRFAQTHEKTKLSIIEKCGHVVNLEQYERFNQVALAFLRRPGPEQLVRREQIQG